MHFGALHPFFELNAAQIDLPFLSVFFFPGPPTSPIVPLPRKRGDLHTHSVSEKIGGREVEDAYPSEPSDSGSESLAFPSDCVVSVLLCFRTRDEEADASSVVGDAGGGATIPTRSSTVLRTCQA